MIKTGDSYARADLDGQTFDTIVIGSGIGGMTTAVLLSKYAGQRVLVLERHYVAGGYTHSFARPGYDWDVGVHYIGDVTHPGHPTRRLFDILTDGEVEFEPMGEVYDRMVIGGEVYDYRAGLREWKTQMLEYFPGEHRAIDGYINAVKDAAHASQSFFAEKALPNRVSKVVGSRMRKSFLTHANTTTGEVLDALTSNPRLKAVLTGQWGDYGLPPARSAFVMHAIVANHYFRGGAFPIGGASTIPAAAAKVIEAAGGRVLISAEVDQIIVQNGAALGVRMTDGRELRADRIVSNAGVHVTYGSLLPEQVARDIGAPGLLDTVTRSLGHLSLYLGLDGTAEELGLKKPNLWVYPSDDFDGDMDAFEADPDAPLPLTYISFPSAKDPDFERRHPGHSTIDVIVPAKHEWFAEWDGTRWHKRGDAYEARKQQFTDRMLAQVFAHVPSAKQHLDVIETSTPLTTQHFTNYGAGELYGLNHNAQRFDQQWLRPRTPIKGLYLTGQDVFTAGVAAAMFGGALTASSMIGPELITKSIRQRLPI
jgi:all-trans-retinol 13,14-reductase